MSDPGSSRAQARPPSAKRGSGRGGGGGRGGSGRGGNSRGGGGTRNRRRPPRSAAPPPVIRPPEAGPSPYELAARQAGANRRRALTAVVLAGAAPALVLAVLAGALLVGWLGLVVLVVVTAAVAAALWQHAPGAAVRSLELVPLGDDERESARLYNLVEGLCAVAGLPKPRLLVLDDPSANCLVVGLRPEDTSLVVTRGLLAGLSRVEMEGLVAHQLSHIRHGDMVLGAVSAVTVAPLAGLVPALGRRAGHWLLGDREAATDVAAIGLTRFPPGLAGALEKMAANPTAPRARGVDLLWDVPPVGRGVASPGNSVGERIGALREL